MFKTTKYIKPELDYIIENANLTEREYFIFMERNKDYPMTSEQIAEKWNVDVRTVTRTVKSLSDKVQRVMNEYFKN